MPTGYTNRITETMTLEEFSLLCSRAMGACVMMRDDPLDKLPPERFEPSPYYKVRSEGLQQDLEKLDAMTLEEIAADMQTKREKALADHEKYNLEKRKQKGVYERMLSMVLDWNPPTNDHKGLKDFMIKQIKESIEFDCTEWPLSLEPATDPAEWKAHRKAKILAEIESSYREYRQEIERTESRNKWLKELRDSLNNPIKTEG